MKYLGALSLIFLWGLLPFFKKQSALDIGTKEHVLINHTLITFFLFIYGTYLFINNEYDFTCLNNIDTKHSMYFLLGALVTVISSIVFTNLVKKFDVSDIMPYIQSGIIVFTGIYGFLLLKEKINIQKIMGYSLIIGGILLANYK